MSQTVGERLKLIRESFGKTQKSMSAMFNLGASTWQGYELKDQVPKSDVLEQLANRGISIDWLVTGLGQMRLGFSEERAFFLHDVIDEELMGRVVDGIVKLYKEENQRLAPIDQGRVAAQLYNDLRSIEDEAERRGALRYALESRRRDLRQAMIAPESSKRQA